ncbi:TPA: hypothetical protein OPR08_002016 [Citrobacter koseri]|uniref:hypothetical protein n=1 Tax=Citrobacter koseri TaxID=545 RepID=UPI000668B517|nr:hypothetical protein [Citrobacter koseri]RZA56916.1 hypothetical protein EVX99_22650 [Citrobacter koseri]HCR9749812.1 hypothetical protein [Citrobacter koseri]HCR9769213.1 hypothetical protein [Citrobacter koseri]HEM6800237.1 hypothetical protein [Citrobacter koseri]HEM7948786.1 hypothetical protein [Citrobacter koseri]
MDIDTIKPLIQQHARDAVFYWQQINTGCFSPLITTEKHHHFHRQLNAHLDGLRAAGNDGWDAALKNYARWKTQGEAFICWLLALEKNNQPHIDALKKIAVGNVEQSVRGMTEAVAWLSNNQARLILTHWRQEAILDEQMLEAWLRATGIAGIVPEEDLSPLLRHANPRIRAACCESVGKLRLHTYQKSIIDMLSESILHIREEAILALAWLSPEIDIVDELHALLVYHLQHAPSRGLAALIIKRKLEYIACITGLCLHQRDPRLEVILAALPERLRLITLAYHGDPIQLPILYKAMENEDTVRLAFWATCFISGLDMTIPEHYDSTSRLTKIDEQQLSFRSDDKDIGLIWPDVPKVVSNCHSLKLPMGPLILGKKISTTYCHELLNTENQAIRFAATWHFAKNDITTRRIDTRILRSD